MDAAFGTGWQVALGRQGAGTRTQSGDSLGACRCTDHRGPGKPVPFHPESRGKAWVSSWLCARSPQPAARSGGWESILRVAHAARVSVCSGYSILQSGSRGLKQQKIIF